MPATAPPDVDAHADAMAAEAAFELLSHFDWGIASADGSRTTSAAFYGSRNQPPMRDMALYPKG